MRRVAVNALDRIEREAARELGFGTLVKRSAAGTVTYATDGSNSLDYDGIVEDAIVEQDKDGFFAQYDPVPVITSGRVNVLILGGDTDIESGNFLLIANDFGMLKQEATAGTRTIDTTVAKALEDEEVSDYSTTLSSASSGSKTLTVSDSSNFSADDMVLCDGGGATTNSELAIIDTVDSSTQITVKENLSHDYSSDTLEKCVQVEVLLL